MLGTLFLHVSKKENTNKSAEKGNGKGKGKEKEKICVDDDAFVEDVSDFELNLRFMGGGGPKNYDAYNPGTNFDGSNSWHSLKVKTRLNSKDKLEEEDEFDEVFLVFREGARLGSYI